MAKVFMAQVQNCEKYTVVYLGDSERCAYLTYGILGTATH